MVKGTVKEFKIRIKRNVRKFNVLLSTLLNHMDGVEVKLHSFSTSAIDGGEGASFTRRPFYPRKRATVLIEKRLGGN